MATKICGKCKQVKNTSEFHKYKREKDGLQNRCKGCRNLENKEYREKEINKLKAKEYGNVYRNEHKEYFKEYDRNRYIKNRDGIIKKSANYYNKNKEKVHQRWLKQKKSGDTYYNRHKEEIKIRSDRHYKENKDYYINYRKTHRKQINELHEKYKKRHPEAVFTDGLRARIRMALLTNGENVKKQFKSMELVGCSIAFLRDYLKSLFKDGMSWDNYGNKKGQWSIDHIIPCCSFDLSDPVQQKLCFHYSNLQPLWHIDNLKKGKRQY